MRDEVGNFFLGLFVKKIEAGNDFDCRGVWGWDDSYIYVGNLSKRIDVINTTLKRTVMELRDPLMRAIPCRIHCHPFNVGTLAGSTAGGQVFVWTAK